MSLVLACTACVTCQPVPTDYQHAVDLSQGFLGPGGPGGSEGVEIYCSLLTAHTVKSGLNSNY